MKHPIINIAPFLDAQGRITALPQKKAKCTAVLAYLAEKFEPNRLYTEKEVNEICLAWHTFNDYFLIRRSLVDEQLLSRQPNGACYWLTMQTQD